MRTAIDGLVLRELPSGENDKLLLILTAKEGKLWVTAKGGRSIKSKKSAICRPFTYGELEIYEKHGKLWLTGGSPNNSFFAYGVDVNGYALASYLTEICEEITGEGEEAELVLRATLNAFYAIEKKLFPLEQIKAAYEFFAATVSGFTPDLSLCSECSASEKENEECFLDVMNGAILCSECAKARKATVSDTLTDIYETKSILMPLDSSALHALRYCAEAAPNRLFNFSITDEKSMKLFCKATEAYLLNHLERGFKTLNFYNSIKD